MSHVAKLTRKSDVGKSDYVMVVNALHDRGWNISTSRDCQTGYHACTLSKPGMKDTHSALGFSPRSALFGALIEAIMQLP